MSQEINGRRRFIGTGAAADDREGRVLPDPRV
jgi:hypothetical protein